MALVSNGPDGLAAAAAGFQDFCGFELVAGDSVRVGALPQREDRAAVEPLAGPRRRRLPWMYEPSPAMVRHLLQRHWRALVNWQPEIWYLPLAVSASWDRTPSLTP